MARTFSTNDGVLILSLLYSTFDLSCEWDTFNTCSRPIHQWLLISYACVLTFRLVQFLGAGSITDYSVDGVASAATDFMLDLRHKDTVTRLLASFTWALALPFFLLWTLTGTWWLGQVLWKTPDCVPSTGHLWFSALWLLLCYVWVGVHAAIGSVALALEFRVRRAEQGLREIEDDDTMSRWGSVSQLSGYRGLSNTKGLSPTDIRALPPPMTLSTYDLKENISDDDECPICLNDLKPGDCVRVLPTCKHSFHRSCIDLWLLRCSDCPLCKQNVRNGSDAA